MCEKFFLVLSVLLVISGCGGEKPKFTEAEMASISLPQRDNLPEPSGGFALAIGEETIASDEIVDPLTEHLREFASKSDFVTFSGQAKRQVEQYLVAKMSNILLYQKAKKDAGVQIEDALEKAADAEVRKFLLRFDNDYAKAEEELRQMEMDWNSFKEYQKKMIMSQSYVSSQLTDDRPVTYSEIADYYNRTKKELYTIEAMLEFRLIDIVIAKVQTSDANQSSQNYARDLAGSLIKRLSAGEDFGELAQKYSHGYRARFGGLWNVRPDSLAEPYDVLAVHAEKIEPGQIAGPIEADGHIFIMKLKDKQQKSVEPLEKVQKQIELKIRFDRRRKAVDAVGAKLIEQAAITHKDAFIDYCVEQIYLRCNQ